MLMGFQTFFFYADLREKGKVLSTYGTAIAPVTAILVYYLWDTENAIRLCGEAVSFFIKFASLRKFPLFQRNFVIEVVHAAWEMVLGIYIDFWQAFLDFLRARLRKWLFEEIA